MHTLRKPGYMERLKIALKNEIKIYINLQASTLGFTHIENAYTIPRVYEAFREWFKEEGILDDENLIAFTVDAEQPNYIGDEIAKKDIDESINFLLEEFPTREEIQNATVSLQNFVDLVHADGKQAGIIRSRPNLDEGDGDGDIELMNHNVYPLEVTWDFSVTMLYRSQRLHTEAEEGSALQFMEDLLTSVYGATKTDSAFVYSRYYFYLFTGIQQTPGDINVDSEHQYIFLGNYKAEFEETTYIQDKEYVYDLDICRHFGEKKVFFYNFEGFLYSFGEDGIQDLIAHNTQFKSWELEYRGYQTQANLLLMFFLVLIDPILYLDPRNSTQSG